MRPTATRSGFTLVEMSIVLVIISLLAAGIMVGKSLVEAANMRGVVNQIERYKVAVKSFQLKYGPLPGDIRPAEAVARGLPARVFGNGDGLIMPYQNGHTTAAWPIGQSAEAGVFWGDLSFTGLIEGNFKSAGCSNPTCITTNVFTSLPKARFGKDKGIAVYGDTVTGRNYFVLLGNLAGLTSDGMITTTYYPSGVATASETYAALTPLQAYNIDTKMDDGLPLTGGLAVLPADIYVNFWANTYLPLPLATPATAATGVCVTDAAGNPYNTDSKVGGNTNACVLRFAFQ